MPHLRVIVRDQTQRVAIESDGAAVIRCPSCHTNARGRFQRQQDGPGYEGRLACECGWSAVFSGLTVEEE